MHRNLLFFPILCFVFLFNTKAESRTMDFEGRVAAFFPQSETFQDVYGDVAPSYQAEVAFCLPWQLKWWGNFSYLNKSGRSDPLQVKTRLEFYSVSTGLKYVFCLPQCFEFYLGAGALYTW